MTPSAASAGRSHLARRARVAAVVVGVLPVLGVVAFYVLSSVVTIATFRSVGTLNWWFLAFWPLSFLVLMTWRSRRLAVRADKSYTAA